MRRASRLLDLGRRHRRYPWPPAGAPCFLPGSSYATTDSVGFDLRGGASISRTRPGRPWRY
jgi:hypothetical protein